MRKMKAGFTLIELMVGILVSAIIFGGVVGIFANGLRTFVTGHKEAANYAEARNVFNDLKTTLKFADKTTIKLNATTGELTYEGPGDETLLQGRETGSEVRSYKRTVKWLNNKQQLTIEKEDADSKGIVEKTTVIFPSSEKNSAFSEEEYVKAWANSVYGNSYSGTMPATPFPVFENPIGVFSIVLPIKYTENGASKVDILRTKVNVNSGIEDDTTNSKAEGLAQALLEVYKTQPDLLKNTGKTNYVSNLTSGSKYATGVAGATKHLMDYIENNMSSFVEKLGNTSWALVAYDASGNPLPSGGGTAVASYKLYMAKNVEDDVPTGTSNTALNDQGTAGQAEIKRLAEEENRYIIRINYGFIVYVYNIDLATGAISQGNEVKYGYACGAKENNVRIILVSTWKPNYLNLIDKNNKRIEDTKNASGTITKGTRYRIDYNGAGEEYTKALGGASYQYDTFAPTIF